MNVVVTCYGDEQTNYPHRTNTVDRNRRSLEHVGMFLISTDTHNEKILKIPIDELTKPAHALYVYTFVEWNDTLFNELYHWIHTYIYDIAKESQYI